MAEKKYTFQRHERLKSRKTIDKLFQKGFSFGQFPLRVVWVEIERKEGDNLAQFALTVPKKKFKKACDRNSIKRLIREAYRLHKPNFYTSLTDLDRQLAMMVIYTGKEMPNFPVVDQAMKKLLSRLAKKYTPPHQPN